MDSGGFVKELCSENYIENVSNWDSDDPEVNPIGYSSIDLTLSDQGYEMRGGAKAMDETIGEMRVHYAGFAHPFFGKNRRTSPEGTPLMFEVREHSFPISLRDDEKLARLEFYRMSKDCEPPEQSDEGDDYNEQELLLSKFFGPWRSSR